MRENNRNSIEKCRKKLPQFTTMNVIDGQAGLISYFSLIFYSLTIDNILNIVILLILAGISIAMFTRSKLIDNAFESKIVTELNQLGEEVNKIKVQGEQELIQEGIFSGSVTNDTLINKQIIISTVTINNPSIKLGIIDISKFKVDSELGKNFSSYSSDSIFNNITDLSDVYAINLETNDIYYINRKVYTVKGTVPPEELTKPIITTDGPTVSITRNNEETENLKFTITVSEGKDNIDLKEDNKYEYYLSTKPNDIVGGVWKEYTSGQEEVVEKTGNREYYIFVKIVEDKNDKISTAIGTNGTEVLVGGEKYHRFGPYEIENGSVLIIDPNGGEYKNSPEKATIKGKNNNSIIINSNDISIDKTITVNFNSNGGSTVNTIKTSTVFDSWTFEGTGKFENSIYTFGNGTGTLTANYKVLSIKLPSPSKTGNTFGGWYTDPDCTQSAGNAGEQYTPTTDVTLYAKWNINQYTLTVNPNGGTWNNTDKISTFKQNYGTTKTISNPTVAPEGYSVTFSTDGGSEVAKQTSTKSFDKWSLSGKGSFNGTTFTYGAGDATLTANYKNNSITLPTPTKTGHTFAGWYTNSECTESAGNSGEQYTPTKDTTLYAKWNVNKYYIDLNFNVDGKSYGQGFENRILVGLRIDGDDKGYIKDYYQEHNYGAKWEIYGLRLDGVDIAYTDSGTLGAQKLSITKYFYTITFNVNNSNYGTVSPTSLIVPNNNTKYTTSSNTLTLGDGRKVTATVTNSNGYTTTFTNWTVLKGTTSEATTSGTITGTTSITANFNRTANTYTASFDSNGGSTANPSSITKKFGEKLGTLPTTSRTGYTFAGWFTSATGGTQITADTTMPVNGATYYAHWNINQYTLTVNPNGGTWNNTTENSTFTQDYGTTKIISNPTVAPEGYTVTFSTDGGSEVAKQKSTKSFDKWTLSGKGSLNGTTFTYGAEDATLTANYKNNSITLPTPTKTGHTFAGWYTNSECTESAGNSGEQYTPTKDTTLYAKWNVNKYKIDLNLSVDGKIYGRGYEDRIYVKLKVAGVDKGYVKDYNVEHDYGTKWEITGLKLDNVEIPYSASGTLGAENFTLIVYFYTITFNVNNGSYGTVSPTSLIVPNNNTKYTTSSNTLTLGDGRKVTATVTNSNGYTTTFTNWTVLKGTTSEATTSGTITGTTSITANFNRTANTYTVSFNSNGGSTANPSSITKKFGEKLGTLPTTSRTGYTFAGWFTSATGGTQITADTTMPVNGATYYAHWNINQYTLTVNPNGGTWNNTDEISTFKQNYGTTKIISNPTVAPEGYTVTFNTDGGSEVAKQKSTKSFDKWTLSGNGNYSSSVNKPSSTGMSVSESSENGEKVYKFSYTANNPSVNTWYSSRFSPYTYTSGDTYEIRFKVRVNSVSNGGNITFRHSALANDYGTPGLKTQTFKATTSGWVDVSLERTISGTTTTLSGKTVTIAPVFEFYTANLLNTTASISFDIKGLEIINKTKHTLLQSMDNKYLFGNGNGTLTANYKNNSIKLPTATKTGHTFAGWYTNPECTQSAGNAGEQYTPTKDTTLYAKWNINQYTLTVNPNGGTWNNTDKISTFKQNYGTTKTISNPTVAPEGYTVTFSTDGGSEVAKQKSTKSFDKWTISGKGSLNGTTFTYGAGDATLTANYKNNSIILPTPTKTGHTFAGWYTNSECTESAGNAGEQYTPTKDITLYAKWSVNKYKIDLNFNVDGKVYYTGYEDRIYVKLKIDGVDKGYVKDFGSSYNYGTKWEITGLKLDNVEIPYTASGTLGAENLNLMVYFYTITFNVNNSNYGTVSPTSLIVPNNNTKYTTSSNTLTLGDGRKVTATVTNSNGYTTTFSNWTIQKGTTNDTITGTTSITANFNRTANTYTANFNSNGGSTANPSSITKKFGEKLGTLPTTSKTGYTFAGWFTSATGGTQITADTTMPVNGATYYAHWNLHPYTLTINPNGGTWNNSADVQEYEQDYGTSKEIPNPTAPKGYTITFNTNGGSTVASQTSTKSFTNWSLSGAGSLSGTTFTFGAGNTTLTANYKNNSITLPTPTKTGSTFAGWYTDSALQHSAGNAGESYTPTANITLYAKWTINKYYIDLNFNVDGKSYGQGFEDRILVGLRIDGDDKGYIKDYYQEHNYGAKWEIYGLRLDGVDIAYTDSGTLGAEKLSITKYFYTITFNANNGTYGKVSPTSLIVPNNNTKYTTNSNTLTLSDGRKVTATVTNENGYTTTFTNWTTSNKETTSGTITGTTTITANFNRTANNYTVKFDSNGGATATPSSITKKYGEKLGTLPTTSKTGYTFAGWFTSATGGTQITSDTTMPVNGATYYAHWNINQYTLTVNPNGGTWNNTTEISSFEQNYGSTKDIPNPTAPSGFTVTFDGNNGTTPSAQTSSMKFVSWSKSGEGTFSNNVFTFRAGNANLTANYSNSSITLPTSSRSGYEFIGWYNMVEGGTKIGDAGASYTPTEDITLYAQWKDIVPPTIDSIKVITQTGVYPAGKVIDIRLQFNEEIKGTSAPTVKVKFGNGAEKTLTPKEISTGQNYIDYTITIAQGDLGVLTISSISGGNITDISGNAATITTVSNTGNIVTADTVGPLASIYEDQNTVTNVSRVSVDVADYETDVAYVELPDGTKQTIYDELKDNVKVLILEEITSSASVSGLKSYEPIIRQYFSNVTVDSSYTAANIANTDFDIVISNANVWESTKQDVLKAAFDAGKNIITLGNDSSNKLNMIENTIQYTTSISIKGKSQLVDNEITPKINFNRSEYSDAQHIITQLIDGAETWYTLEYNGKEYPAISYYEEHDTRWFHSQMANMDFDSVMPYLIRKLTRITTASYEIPGPGTYTFKIYDQAGNCTEKTITTGNYKVTFEYNEGNVKNGDFSNGLTNWRTDYNQPAVLDSNVLYNGKASVRFQVASNLGNWIGFSNTSLKGTFYANTLYKISFAVYKDSTSAYGDANTYYSVYCPETTADGTRVDTSAVMITPKADLQDRCWKKVEKEFTTKGTYWENLFTSFNTGGGGPCPASTIWVADFRVERIQNQTKSYGSTMGTLPTLSRTGYTFQGWYTAPEGGTRITESTKVLSGNVTYYAHWARNSAPAKPSKPDLLTAHDTGFSNTDNATYWWSQINLSGTAEAGSTLKLYRNNAFYKQTTVSANGTWSMNVDNYQNSWTSWVAYATNSAGTSPASDALSVCSDISVPYISGLSATATSASKYRLNITASEAGGSGIRGYYVSTSSAKPSISSGWAVTSATSYTFNNANPSTTYYVWVADNAGNISNVASITPQPINYSVNNTAWCTTFQQAVSLAGNGHTIYLLKNISDGSAGTINKSLTFTTNGHNLTRTASITVNAGCTVTITGSGTLTGNMGTLIYNVGTLNISHSGTISATASASNNVSAIQNNAGATINKTGGGTVHGANIGIYSQGRVNMSAGTVTGGAGHALKVGTATGSLSMTGGTLSNSNTYGALNVYTGASATVSGGTIRNNSNSALSTYGTTTISGSPNISGANSGITVQSGTLRVQGGTITGGSHGLINRGQCIISGGTIYTTGSSEAVSNGTASESVGLMQISGGTIYTTGSASAVTNHSSQTWPTSSKSGYITYCTQTDSAKKACTIHITGSSVIEARGSGYAIRNTSAAKTGAIHIPGTFSGRVYAKNNYVLVNTSTGSKYIYMNGGNLYCPKGSKYYSYGNVSINSAVRKYNRAP